MTLEVGQRVRILVNDPNQGKTGTVTVWGDGAKQALANAVFPGTAYVVVDDAAPGYPDALVYPHEVRVLTDEEI